MTEILTKDLIVASGAATTKDEAIREAGNLLLKADAVTAAYVEAMAERQDAAAFHSMPAPGDPTGRTRVSSCCLVPASP